MVAVPLFVALLCLVAAVSLRRGVAADSANREARVWLAWACGIASVMFAGTVVIRQVGASSAVWAAVAAVGTVVSGGCAYEGLLRLHRRSSVTARAEDWANGVAALLALVGGGNAVAGRLLPQVGWFAQAGIVQVCVWALVLGTATSLLRLTGLGRRVWAWLTLAGLWLLLVAYLAVAAAASLTDLVAAVGSGPIMPLVWAGCAAAVVVATRRPAPELVREVSASSAAGGATLIVASALAIVVADAAVPGGVTPVAVVACAAAGAVGLARLGFLVGELARLAASRVEARTDELTGLVNRRGFLEELAVACEGADGAGVAIVDMDGFKEVNDILGHAGGDQYIAALAAKFSAAMPTGTVLARIGGDEFGAVVPTAADLGAVARGLLSVAREPIRVQGRRMVLEASAGVAVCGEREVGADELMRRADAAMYVAKRSGGGVLREFDEQLDAVTRGRQSLVRELRELLVDGATGEHGHLVVHYQPQVDIESGAVHGAEALVRWQHPRLGLLSPGVFLPLVEEHAMTMPLTTRVLRLATADAARWPEHLAVSVNVAGADLADPSAVAAVEEALAASGLAPWRLTIEVTETMLMRDPAASSTIMERLRPRGIRFGLDDYGTGYSTLALLKDLPVDELKIDRSFVAQLTGDERTRAIIAGTIRVAHDLGMTVVGEGVEDEPTLGALHSLGCDLSQGFLHATPLPEPVFRAWTARQAARTDLVPYSARG
jgi:diguanylate cyclase (GGDEF)-like protein